jgi:hypothetical protein
MTLASLPPPLEHPDLGQVQGRYGKGVIQYLGLKYASLEHRFAEPELATYDASSTIDGMKHGLVPLGPNIMLLALTHKPDLQYLHSPAHSIWK